MKKLLLLFVLLTGIVFDLHTYAQGWLWGRSFAPYLVIDGWGIATDASGNVYGAGNLEGYDSIGYGSVTIPGYNKLVWMKYDNRGATLWADGATDASLFSITTDPSGNLIIFGSCSGLLQINSYTGASFSLPGAGNYFLAKINSSGDLLWAIRDGNVDAYDYFQFSGGINVSRGSVTTDSAGNIYIASTFRARTISIGPYLLTDADTSGGHAVDVTTDVFMAKYTPSGSLAWATSTGGTSDDFAFGIKATTTGNVYLCGAFYSPTITVGSSVITNPYGTGGVTDWGKPLAYIAKFSAATGVPLWAQAAGGSNGAMADALTSDANGNIFMTGGFCDTTINFGAAGITRTYPPTAFPPTFPPTPVSYTSALFLVRYAHADVADTATWGKTIGSATGPVFGSAIALSPCGVIWVSGQSGYNVGGGGPVNIDGYILPVSTGPPDPVFFAGYNVSGGVFGYAALGSGGDDNNGIACDPDGNLFACGDWFNNLPPYLDTFVLGPDTFSSSPGGEYWYLGKYAPGSHALTHPSISISANPDDTVCDGIPVSFSTEISGAVSAYQWYVNGTIVSTSGSSFTYFPSNGDSVRCVITVSTGACSGDTVISSNTIHMVVDSTMPPATISGTSVLCAGAATTLTDAVSGGTWTSGSTAVAIAGSLSGVVSGITAGTANITYSLGTGCTVTKTITINPTPKLITGNMSLCLGDSAALSDSTLGGIWSSASPAIATIDSATGIVLGIAAGTVGITYMFPTGCGMAIATLTVNSLPPTIAGTGAFCLDSMISLSDASSGGTWSSSNTAIATIGSLTGAVSGVATGTAIMSYSFGTTGCTVTKIITVEPLPEMYSVTGGGSYCVGGTGADVGLSGSGMDVQYQLYYGASATGSPLTGTGSTLDFGLQTLTGTYTVVATNLVTGCTQNMADSAVITITPVDTTYVIHDTTICYYSDAQVIILTAPAFTGGIWFSGSIAATDTINAPGAYWFIYPDTTGCAFTAYTFQVAFVPLPPPISGNNTVCSGDTLILNDAITGGTWASSSPAIASINTANGVVSGISAGIDTITYSLLAGCSVTQTITIIAPPCTTGVPSIVNNNTLEIFPNPTDDQLTIQTNAVILSPAEGQLTITNNIGQQLIQQQITSTLTTVNIQSLPPGMYYITLKGENGIKTEKFVKE